MSIFSGEVQYKLYILVHIRCVRPRNIVNVAIAIQWAAKIHCDCENRNSAQKFFQGVTHICLTSAFFTFSFAFFLKNALSLAGKSAPPEASFIACLVLCFARCPGNQARGGAKYDDTHITRSWVMS